MDCERSNITVLIVDHDEVYLSFLANILMAWQYKVFTAKDAHHALVTLRENKGVFDLVITEFHIVGMNGFEFQKHIQDQFKIPIIMMSEDNRPNIISKTLENGAAHYIAKPFFAEDFKDIWKYAKEAKKDKLFIESLFVRNEEQATSSEPKTKRKYGKRKSEECQGEGEFQVVKKTKLVWTHSLHNLFVHAIERIGLDRAVPKTILEIMNVRNLTRENVASHLQKYRIFLRDVAEKGMEGDISHRALRSRFASSLPMSVLKEIQEKRANKLRAPILQYFQTLAYRNGDANNVLNHFNQFPTHHANQFPYIQKGLTLQDLDQVRLEKSKWETNVVVDNNVNGQSRFGISSSNLPFFQLKNSFNDGASTSYGGGQGLIASSPFNHGSIGSNTFNHGVKNSNFGSLIDTNIMPQNVTSNVRNNNPLAIQLNKGVEMVGIGTLNNGLRASSAINNNFGFNEGVQNQNMNFGSLVNENFGLVQGGFGLNCISDVRRGSESEFLAGSINNEGNVYKNREFPLQKLDGNVVENEKYNGANFVNEVEFNQMEFNFSDFLMAGDMNLHNEELNKGGDDISPQAEITSCVMNESPIDSNHNSQFYKGGDDISPSAGITSCVLNKSLISENQNFKQLYKGVDDTSPQTGITSCVLNESSISSGENFKQLYKGADDISPSSGITSCMLNELPISSGQTFKQLYKGVDDISPPTGITSCVLNESPISSSQNFKQIYKGADDISPSSEITSCVLNESPISLGQTFNQLYKGVDDISPSAGSTSCALNESPISSGQNIKQLQGNESFSNGEPSNRFLGDEVSKASTSSAHPEFDMDLIVALFGTIED